MISVIGPVSGDIKLVSMCCGTNPIGAKNVEKKVEMDWPYVEKTGNNVLPDKIISLKSRNRGGPKTPGIQKLKKINYWKEMEKIAMTEKHGRML